jgi:hypothetical protein
MKKTFVGLLLAQALGCEVVLGIEDRFYEEPETQASALCQDYCDAVMSTCVDEFQVYAVPETCLGVCALLDEGDSVEPSGNTVACRAEQARLAELTREYDVHCPRAGPGGDGFCGENCESYCALFSRACADQADLITDCERKCGALEDLGSYSALTDGEGDSLQCRLIHASSASVEPDPHCAHARLVATSPCDEADGVPPDCADYCRLVMTACTEQNAVYESERQCLDVCEALPPGAARDRAEASVGCRRVHAYNALSDPDTHCPHAGPGGDGVCGRDTDTTAGSCVAYCQLVAEACSSGFAERYADAADCERRCSEELEEPGATEQRAYSVESAQSNPGLGCRILHTARAFEDAEACREALGEGACALESR